MAMNIGVLALQGAFERHIHILSKLGLPSIKVKSVHDLSFCDGLIIPGGESTVIYRHLLAEQFIEPLKQFNKPIYGTCAGMILISKTIHNSSMQPLGLIDISVVRNAYGRQIDSFATRIEVKGLNKPFEAIFIRAPVIRDILSPAVEVLATNGDQAVFVKQGHYFASSFHPELTHDSTIHQLFVEECQKVQNKTV